MTIPGVGPLVATAIVSAAGNGRQFSKARDMAAWLGLVPRQHSTGGKTTRQLSQVNRGPKNQGRSPPSFRLPQGRSDTQRADINSGKVRATWELFGTD